MSRDATSGPDREAAPEWFTRALDTPVEIRETVVNGARIAMRCWGPPGPGIVLIHGGAAHSRWWDHVAPSLAQEYRVVAPDLSGHGDSDRRSCYTLSDWAQEVIAATRIDGMGARPIVVGHSMGGWVALTAGIEHGDILGGVVTLDAPVRPQSPEDTAAARRTAFGPLRRYVSHADAVAHFRTVPDQPSALPYVVDHIARTSVVDRDGAWTWKFDPAVFDRDRPTIAALAALRCRSAVFRAERGIVSPNIGAQLQTLLGDRCTTIEIPLAGHHVMLDQPLPLIASLRTIIAVWNQSAAPAQNADGTVIDDTGLSMERREHASRD
jgi:pimeloyl-ACP methyl ester carboxylesterase